MVSDDLCTVNDNVDSTLCMESSQSNLLGMSGTYHQFNNATPYWFREHTNCDERPGFLLFDDGYFFVWDSFDDIDVALCRMDAEYYNDESSWEVMKFRPDLCTNWVTLVDTPIGGSYDLQADNTFSIWLGGSCTDNSCTTTDVPDQICFSKSTNAWSFMEGDYALTGTTGDIYGYPEYERSDTIYYEGEQVPVYLWFFGDALADTTLKWWAISSSSLAEAAMANGSVSVYGFCEADTENPVDCAAGWRFFFLNSFALDESFEMAAGECVEQIVTTTVYPEYLCIDGDESDGSFLPMQYYAGGYVLNETGSGLSGGIPHWVKPQNDNWDYHDVYLYYDGFYGWWQIGNGMHTFAYVELICFGSDGLTPFECNQWYDYYFDPVWNIKIYECTEEEFMSLNPQTEALTNKSNTGTTTIIAVLVVLFVIGVCVVGIWWAKGRRDQDLKRWGSKIDSNKEAETPVGISSGTIEMDKPFSQTGKSGHSKQNTHSGLPFDMSPLNTNAPTHHLDPSIEDFHDEYSSDGHAGTGDVLE